MKNNMFLTLALLCGLFAFDSVALTPGRVTMLVVPARYSVMQIAFDIAQKYPVVLVSYQGDASSDAPLLHAWNGTEWIKLTMEEYANAGFLQVTPGEALLVGDEQLLPPVLASSILGWCPKVTTIPSIDTATLVNSFAKEFSFNQGAWNWFAKRYNLLLNDENVERRTTSWYDRPVYEDQYTPKVNRWLGGSGSGSAPASGEMTEPDVPAFEMVPVEDVPLDGALEIVPEPAGDDLAPAGEPEVNAEPAVPPDAAFTDSPMPEEDVRKALQAPQVSVEESIIAQPEPAEQEPPLPPDSDMPPPQPAEAGEVVQ